MVPRIQSKVGCATYVVIYSVLRDDPAEVPVGAVGKSELPAVLGRTAFSACHDSLKTCCRCGVYPQRKGETLSAGNKINCRWISKINIIVTIETHRTAV